MQREVQCPKYKMHYAKMQGRGLEKMQGRGLEKMLGRGPSKERCNAQNIKCIMQRELQCQKFKIWNAKRGKMPNI
jgi:hypothetical protein